jgi:hypothetical protein
MGGAATLEPVAAPIMGPFVPQQRTLPDWRSAQMVSSVPEMSMALSTWHWFVLVLQAAPTTQVLGVAVPQHAWPTTPQAVQTCD